MKYALLLALLAVTAHGAKLQVVWPVADGHDSYRIERKESNGTKPTGALYIGKRVPRAYEQVVSTITNELNEVETVTNAVPISHSLCKWLVGAQAPVARSEAEIAAKATYDAAQAQVAQVAQLQAIVDNPVANKMIKDLEALVTELGLERPVAFMEAIVDLNAAIAVNENASNWKHASKGNRQSTTLLALYLALVKAELDEDTINAVWTYMVATGQDQ